MTGRMKEDFPIGDVSEPVFRAYNRRYQELRKGGASMTESRQTAGREVLSGIVKPLPIDFRPSILERFLRRIGFGHWYSPVPTSNKEGLGE